jgi:hypothetical protein
MRAYQERDVNETRRLYDEVFKIDERKTLHEFTAESNGITVVIFNTKVVVVMANGTVQEFARS